MSKTKITLVCLFSTILSFAQQGINYKALIRDNSGNPVVSQLITIQFDILKSGTTSVYKELHTPTTDANGLIILNIGQGTVISGNFTTIDWASTSHSLNVQVNTGAGLTDMGTTAFMAVPYAKTAETATTAKNVSGLEKITENGKTGLRLTGKDPNSYGDIGNNAVDLSFSSGNSALYGATGDFSIAMGIETIASGDFSIAMGVETIASGKSSTSMGVITTALAEGSIAMGSITTASGRHSTAMGYNTTASGISSTAMGSVSIASGVGSTAMGDGARASGSRSTAMGLATRASGTNSTAMGRRTRASGVGSTAMGVFTTASGEYSTAMGTYNIDNNAGELFMVGNGSENNLQNAFTVYKGKDASLADNSGFVVIGNQNKENLVFDENEIIARKNGALSDLFLQRAVGGKKVVIGPPSGDNGNGGLFVHGKIYLDGNVIHTSDRRYKKDIENLSYGLKEVLQLQPKAYYWKNHKQEHKSLGLIAQDVQPILKEVVTIQDNKEKTLGISYTELIPILINAIKEQQAQINNLKNTVSSQETVLVQQQDSFQELINRIEVLEKVEKIQTLTKNN